MSKTALITGASSGIGAVYAQRLAARGYDLVLVARRADRLTDLATRLQQAHSVAVRTLVADLSAESGMAGVEAVLRDQQIDLLVNNAGMGPISPSADLSDEATAQTLALNITALTRLTRAALPGMRARKSGTIVNIGSVLAFHALPVTSLYSATKAFVLTYSRGIQQEVQADGIHVQAVLPAGTVTEFYETAGVPISNFDQSVFMTAEQLVDAALTGLDRGEEVTLPSVHDLDLWNTYDAARQNLFGGTQNGSPASRYTAA
ncbi:MAG TPA: SDR family oxidoreductase [Devosia sp.]|nr:SDR family oxidoreductase [Devosia sp.]